jgi:D-lactate dehydrogenase
MKAAMYSVHRFERTAFDRANRDKIHEIEYLAAPLNAATARLAEGCEAVIPSLNDTVDKAVLQLLAEHGVKLIALRSAGYNNLDLAATASLGFKAVYVPVYTPHAVAEHVFALTLALLRHLPRAYQRVRDENFDVEGLVGTLLYERTFGIIGLGKIGRVVAGIANGFGCKVIACDPHADPQHAPCPLLPLDRLLAESHVVSLHVPLTAETRHLMNAERLARMQPGAILINTSRGPLVDTAALIEVLKGGALWGVALDVYERESGVFYLDYSEQGLSDDVLARLLTFPKVIVTSHMGYLTWEALGEIAATTIASLTEFQHGKTLTHELKLAAGSGSSR